MNTSYRVYRCLIFQCSLVTFLLAACERPGNEKEHDNPGVAVLLVDTDRKIGNIPEAIYGQFLEHINHAVVDGLFAEQIRGQGFEGDDFVTDWSVVQEGSGEVSIEEVRFEVGEKSGRLKANGSTSGMRQARLYIQERHEYNGSVWIKP